LFNVKSSQQFSSNGQIWWAKKLYITSFNWAWNRIFYEGLETEKHVETGLQKKPVLTSLITLQLGGSYLIRSFLGLMD